VKGLDFRKRLAEGTVLFDGAMGTWYAEKFKLALEGCEMANIRHPERVLSIHREYIDAGADAIKTNTFAANPISLDCDEQTAFRVIERGWEIACSAVFGSDVFVFADIGPIPQRGGGNNATLYKAIADKFLQLGAKNFLFETFPLAEGLGETAAHIKKHCPEAFIICSFAVTPDGHTRMGASGVELFEQMNLDQNIDAAGFNCVSGPNHMRKLLRTMPKAAKPISAMPNAGYPTVVGSRTFFGNTADYFAEQLALIAGEGAGIVGGCCGSTPEFIKKTRQALKTTGRTAGRNGGEERAAAPVRNINRLADKLAGGKKVVAVELDPPAHSDIRAFVEGAASLCGAGADAITIADCPVSRARADSSLLACKLKRELGIDVIPHMTCRDRNLNATKALLLGLNFEGVGNVLAVTGDPIPSAEREDIKSVYNFNAPMLISFIRGLRSSLSHGEFSVFAALNINAVNFEHQLDYAQKKIESGAIGFLTQPVHSPRALENLKRARGRLGAFLLGGVMPIVSYRNACFMNNEISGIEISEEIVEQYRDLTREQAGELAVRLSVETAHDMADFVDGYYIITPFSRTDIVAQIIEGIKPAAETKQQQA
jgi:methionine synthase I (cobalamin-dependent)/5,10-methylenetetrahydrofolate reductase